tara:strand:+ start:245 stop:415 length:171 start_codon:yes stop_codon:yes gene_type:complete
MWNEREMETRNTIIDSAYNDLERKLTKWWNDQEQKKEKNQNYKIEPYIIWSKRNLY